MQTTNDIDASLNEMRKFLVIAKNRPTMVGLCKQILTYLNPSIVINNGVAIVDESPKSEAHLAELRRFLSETTLKSVVMSMCFQILRTLCPKVAMHDKSPAPSRDQSPAPPSYLTPHGTPTIAALRTPQGTPVNAATRRLSGSSNPMGLRGSSSLPVYALPKVGDRPGDKTPSSENSVARKLVESPASSSDSMAAIESILLPSADPTAQTVQPVQPTQSASDSPPATVPIMRPTPLRILQHPEQKVKDSFAPMEWQCINRQLPTDMIQMLENNEIKIGLVPATQENVDVIFCMFNDIYVSMKSGGEKEGLLNPSFLRPKDGLSLDGLFVVLVHFQPMAQNTWITTLQLVRLCDDKALELQFDQSAWIRVPICIKKRDAFPYREMREAEQNKIIIQAKSLKYAKKGYRDQSIKPSDLFKAIPSMAAVRPFLRTSV